MRNFLGTFTGKTIRLALLFRRGGGQALPGLVVERLFPDYVPAMLTKLPGGVIVITGTNGKTTTTKMLVEILKANGKRVLTNSTGSNLIRGIASSVAQSATPTGRLPYDMAVLEIDEAAAKAFTAQVKPRWVLALNVSRDQLDRFGEVDTIASYIKEAMAQAQDGIVTNAADPHLAAAAKQAHKETHYFTTAASLKKYFPTDYELGAVNDAAAKPYLKAKAEVELKGFKGNEVTYRINGRNYKTKLQVSGQHNYLNGAAALTLALQLLPDIPPDKLVTQLAEVQLAFGRGEKYRLKNGAEIELVLVKNPASFTQALASYDAKAANLMIAINDNIADGRDVSWLWDVNFEPLGGQTVFLTSGRRAADMAMRLCYDDIKVSNMDTNLVQAVRLLSKQKGPKVILSTYTAMLQLYKLLSKNGRKIP